MKTMIVGDTAKYIITINKENAQKPLKLNADFDLGNISAKTKKITSKFSESKATSTTKCTHREKNCEAGKKRKVEKK